MTTTTHIDKAVKEAESLGKYHGENAAQWAAQDSWGGRVASIRQSEENARAFLKGIEEGDPMIMDSYASPNLSGEWADSMTEADLLKAVFDGFDSDIIDTLEPEEIDDIANAYIQAASDGFWQELETSAATIADNSGLPSED
jgi:hypothetical protein